MCRRSPCHLDENEGEHREHRRLDKPDEDLEKQEWERDEIRHEMEHHREEHFSRKHIAEQSERKREKFRHLAHHLEESHDRAEHERLVERTHEELRRIPAEAERRDPRELDREHRDERERDRHIEIRRSTADERDDGCMPFMYRRPPDRSHPREESHPIGDEDEEEYRRGKREKFPSRLPITHDVRREIHECIENRLHDILKSPRYQLEAPRKKREAPGEEQCDEECRHYRIRHRKPEPVKVFLRRN